MTTPLIVLAALCLAAPVAAESAREILDRARAADEARRWDDQQQTLTMRIVDRNGSERVRRSESFVKGFVGSGDYRAITFFRAPPDLDGVGLLQWAHRDRVDQMWLYSPELERTRQISESLMDESYQGTDFTYRDLELISEVQSWTEEEASSSLLREEDCGARRCSVIQLVPKRRDLPYRRIVLWLDTADLLAHRLELYDGGDALQKVWSVQDYRDVQGIPTPHRIEFATVPLGTKTIVEVESATYNQGLGDDLFTRRHLERGGR